MKRIIGVCITLIMVLIMVNSSIAEDFTLHSGVKFGMTLDEITALESAKGFNLEDIDADYGFSRIAYIKKIRGKIAGIEKSFIDYLFDENNKMFAATYSLGTLPEEWEPDYSNIENALIKKYGDPDNVVLPLVNRIGFAPLGFPNSLGLEMEKEGTFPPYSSWLVHEDNGNYVAIVHYKIGITLYGIDLKCNVVGYQEYSAEEITAEIDNVANEAEEISSQRENDL